jgi:oxygen-independent coproporphyrinogen-3 oxidase
MKQFSGVKVNLDFIYGLPLQTPASFGNSIDKAIKISPDRLVTFSYAHLPAIKKPQKHLEKYGIPGAEEKIRLFETAYSKMVEAGYVPIGLDHFAKSTDELSISLAHKELHRNFQGYCTRKTTGQVYAFGTSSISQLESAYIQNTKNLTEYIDLVNLEHLPVKKSLLVTDGQKIVRDLINEIMCNQYLDIEKAITKFGMSTDEYYNKFQPDMASLKDLENDGIINIDGHVIELTDTGRFFIRNVAVVFDPLFKSSAKTFSKSI